MSPEKTGRWPLLGGVVAAITASLCCIGPLVLVMLGIGGSWIANLSALEPFRPYFLGASLIFLFFAWKKIYRDSAKVCVPDSLCALPQTSRVYKLLFWMAVVLIGLALASPYLAPLLY
jgi:mercuric ion transport protein